MWFIYSQCCHNLNEENEETESLADAEEATVQRQEDANELWHKDFRKLTKDIEDHLMKEPKMTGEKALFHLSQYGRFSS